MTLRQSPRPTLAPLLLAVLLGGECGRTHIHPTDHCPSPLTSPASARTLEKDTEVSGARLLPGNGDSEPEEALGSHVQEHPGRAPCPLSLSFPH